MRLRDLISETHKINNFTTNGVVKRQAEARRKLKKVKNLKGAKEKAERELQDIQTELPNYLKRNI